VVATVATACLLWALARLYRRFSYTDGAQHVWGIADDVYISACFGRSLVHGDGLVWYAGAPRVEGISNPLWTCLIGLVHWLPGFNEDRLGLYVVSLNALLLCISVVLFWSTAKRQRLDASSAHLAVVTLLIVPCNVAIAYWSAEGFEVALIAALAFGQLRIAQRASRVRHALAFGLCAACGLATRMDYALVALPGLIAMARAPRHASRLLGIALAAAALPTAALLVMRRMYYGDWLPNTYYLKASGWPLGERLKLGVAQNRALLWVVALVGLWLLIPVTRRMLRQQLVPVAAAWLSFGATVLYSTLVGGDSWHLFAGYDRHTVVGGMFLSWGLALAATALGRNLAMTLLATWFAVVLAAWPVVGAVDSLRQLHDGLLAAESPLRTLERGWIAYGKQFRQVSKPGARIALCPAGAVVYFSHRGGVDLLGKVEPFIARLPASSHSDPNIRCFRNAPGHNKGDDAAVFRLRQPDFSRMRPPQAERSHYVRAVYGTASFFVRRDTGLARWELLEVH
jgi:hypothetical protein